MANIDFSAQTHNTQFVLNIIKLVLLPLYPPKTVVIIEFVIGIGVNKALPSVHKAKQTILQWIVLQKKNKYNFLTFIL